MINVTVSLNKFNKKIFFVLFAFCVVSSLYLFASALNTRVNAETNEQRTEYIASLGFCVVSAPSEVKTVTVPYRFDGVYEDYNKLQRAVGFDLMQYRGKNVTVYTYPFADKSLNADVHLMVYDGVLIGGDICGRELGSPMYPLSNDSAAEIDGS